MITVSYPETAFVSKGANKVKPLTLAKSVQSSGSITTVIRDVRVNDKGAGSTPEVDDATGRTWAFVFDGSGSLPAPEQAALDAIVAAHTGVESYDPSPRNGGTIGQAWSNVDGTSYGWATPAGGEGGVETIYRLASDYTRSSTTPDGVTGWSAFSLAAGKRHKVRIRAIHRVLVNGHNAGRIGINCANSPSDLWADATFFQVSRGAGSVSVANDDRNNQECETSGTISLANSDRLTVYEAMFTAHASGGNMEIIWAAATAGQDARLRAGSLMTITEYP